MVTLEKFGDSAIKFGFEDNALYLNNGEITVPLNALMLVIDESGLATFKKLNGDPFVSVSYADLGMDKDELEQWYKDNMVGGGSESGLTPSDVQDMIDASISGYDEDIQDEIGEKEQVIAIALTELKNDKADTSAVTEAIDAATSGKVDTSDYETYTAATDATLATKADKNEIPSVSGYADSVEYNSTTKYVNFYHGGTGGTVVYSFNAAPFVIDGMVQNVVISGGSLVISFNTDAGKQDISIPLTEIFDPSNYYDKTATDAAINAAVSGKADNATVTAHTANTAIHVSSNEKYNWNNKLDASAFNTYSASTDARLGEDEEVTAAALNALEDELANKQDALVAGDNITISGNVISAEGGGKSIEGGRGITVTTGDSADTVSFNLPISAATSGDYILNVGASNQFVDGTYNGVVIGTNNTTAGGRTGRSNKNAYIIGTGNSIVHVGSGGGDKTTCIGFSNSTHGMSSSVILGLNNNIGSYGKKYNGVYVFGHDNKANSAVDSDNIFMFGASNSGVSDSWIFGDYNEAVASSQFLIGRYSNAINDGSSSGTTLFSVGNGTSNSARHNAFEIRKNGDIYIVSGGTDIKLQDNLGGGSITIDPTLDSGSTNAVANSAITAAFDDVDARLGEDEEVTAAALNALNDGINSVNDKFGGLRIVKLSQQEYDALVTKDNNTMYVVV